MLTAKFLLLPALAALALVATSKPAQAKAGEPAKAGANQVPPPDMLSKIAAAFQAADPAQLRQLADEVEAAGFKAQADDLRAFAKKIEAAIAAQPNPPAKAPSSPVIPPSVPGAAAPAQPAPPLTSAQPSPAATPPAIVLPEVVVSASGPTQQQKLLAGKVALMLRNRAKGSEDKDLVGAFQQQELDANHAPGGAFGNVPSKRDGLYGPKSALQLARHYGIVPPKPLYWSKVNWLTDKKNYRTEMQRFAAIDPQRADEWAAAAKVL